MKPLLFNGIDFELYLVRHLLSVETKMSEKTMIVTWTLRSREDYAQLWRWACREILYYNIENRYGNDIGVSRFRFPWKKAVIRAYQRVIPVSKIDIITLKTTIVGFDT